MKAIPSVTHQLTSYARRGILKHRTLSKTNRPLTPKRILSSSRGIDPEFETSLLSMTTSARPIFCDLQMQKLVILTKKDPTTPKLLIKPAADSSSPENVKILHQPRLCTLRSYSSSRTRVIRSRRDDEDVTSFSASLSEYIESFTKSQDFELLSGRLAMMVFATTVTMEVVTGNSLFQKMDLQRIAEAAGVCLCAVVSTATFTWFSSARTKVGQIFTLNCNTFIDSLIDKLVDGLFYDEPSDWSEDM